MKLLPVHLIREADAYTIANEPVADIDLMERAASACFRKIMELTGPERKVHVFCGSGNNGGDGLAIARMLHGAGYETAGYILGPPEKMSENCRTNLERLRDAGHGFRVLTAGELPAVSPDDLVIDALFGSGLTRVIDGFPARVIRHINESGAMVIAVDVPSGLFCDEHTPGDKGTAVVRAHHTLTFSPPKLAFFFPENHPFVGEWHLLDIGIMEAFIDRAETKNFLALSGDIAPLLRKRGKYDHKGTFGHALLITGSAGKMGAAVLAARACLRSGPGLVTVRVPRSGATIVQTAVPEAMLAIDGDESEFSQVPDLSVYSAIAAGPGLGTSGKSAAALKILIQETRIPLLFDADAINILGENRTWLGFLPPGCIFTPHPKEFERLAGKAGDHFDRNRLQREFSVKNRCYVVLKGAHTAITTPDGRCFFNTTGNPGMATGGSGDVLTGILAGLSAQGYPPLETCLLGVYLHGLAGDLAASALGYEALIANDIIENLGKSFLSLYGKL